MPTIPRDLITVDPIQELLIELFWARDRLGAAADVLTGADVTCEPREVAKDIAVEEHSREL